MGRNLHPASDSSSPKHERKHQHNTVIYLLTKKKLSGLCGLTVERSLAILKVAGSNLGRSASR